MKKWFILLLLCAPLWAQNTKSGSITGTTCFGVDTTNAGTVGISVQNSSTGAAWSGTIQASASIGGDPATNISVTSASGTSQTTITANGVYYAAISGSTYVQVCGNTVTNTAAIKMFPAQYSKNIGGSGGGAGAAQATTAWNVARFCGGAANCTVVKADGKYVIDATSNSSTTITCPNNDCNFTQADVGKTVWATTQGTGVGIGFLIYTTYVCPVTTIQSVNSAQSITVGTACTANATANAALYWATDDGAALASLDAAVGCSTVYLPDPGVNGTYILTSQPFLVNPISASVCNQQLTSSVGNPAPALTGTGWGSPQSTIMIHPNFNWAACKAITGASENVCIGGTARSIANLMIIGSGLTSASNSTGCAGAANKIVLSGSPTATIIYGVDMAGICPGASGMRGIEVNASDEIFAEGGVQEVGTVACAAHGTVKGILFQANDCHDFNVSGANGLVVDAGAQMTDIGSYPIQSALVNGSLIGRGTHFVSGTGSQTAVSVGGSASTQHYGDFIGVDTIGIGTNVGENVSQGGKAYFTATTITASVSSISNSGQVFSQGNNQLNALALTGTTGVWFAGGGTLLGTCSGTATSSSTLGLFRLGQFTSASCTSTTVNVGYGLQSLPLSGSIFALNVQALTGCAAANTCVFTVLKTHNGTTAATTLTCSLTGGATGCQDNSHFDIGAAGDAYSIQFTTGATETLANVTATVVAW